MREICIHYPSFGLTFTHSPGDIYHVAVMPCYDKKLEASRQDFYNDAYSTRDVDCVITTGELELLMREKDWDLSTPLVDELVPTPPRTPPYTYTKLAGSGLESSLIPELVNHPGTSSGSYLHSLISSIKSNYGKDLLELTTRTVRSSDYEEYTLTNRGTGEVVFKGAKCYGFRNLQNVVRKIGKEAGVQVGRGAAGRMVALRGRAVKKGAVSEKEKSLDYVEVMACPGGCVNGGGQLKPSKAKQLMKAEDEEGYQRDWQESGAQAGNEPASSKWGDKEWTKEVEKAYWRDMSPLPDSSDAMGLHNACADQLASQILTDLCQPIEPRTDAPWTKSMDDIAEGRRRELFRTQYTAVEGEVDGLIVKW